MTRNRLIHFISRGAGAALLASVALGMSARAATISHIYDLNGSFADALGGPSLVPTGGALMATTFDFGRPINAVNEGLTVSNAFADPGNYSIEVRFRWTDDEGGWGRILDFNTMNDDQGIYTNRSNVMVYHSSGPVGASPMPINTDFHAVFTRSAGSNTFTAYLNNVQQFQFLDTAGVTRFSSPGNPAVFFKDDGSTGDTRPGSVDQIRIFDGALTAAEVGTLFSGDGLARAPIPVPGGPYSILSGEELRLDAGASTDPDAEFGDAISRYEWDLNGDGLVDFVSTAPTLEVSAAEYGGLLAAGTTTARLRAVDTIGNHAAASDFTIELVAVPEPGSMALAVVGAAALLLSATRGVAARRNLHTMQARRRQSS